MKVKGIVLLEGMVKLKFIDDWFALNTLYADNVDNTCTVLNDNKINHMLLISCWGDIQNKESIKRR